MKKTETKEIVKSTEFANTIFQIRQERNLTQKDLGEIIGVSDRTISKWENGTTVPDLCQIRNICKKLEISPSLLIKSEKKFVDGLGNLKRKIGKALNYVLHNIFLIGFILIFILLLIYFINNFNSVKIYSLKYDSENISIENGYFFKTKVTNILIINDIKVNKIKYNPTEIELQLYTYVNGDKKILYTSNNLNNIYIEENNSGSDLLGKDTIESIKRNLYLTIQTKDENDNTYNYECKITFKEKYNNNKLSYKEYIKKSVYETMSLPVEGSSHFLHDVNLEKTSKTSSKANSKNKLESLDYDYNEEKDIYTKVVDENTTIYFKPNTEIIEIRKNEKNNSINIVYYYNLQKICLRSVTKDKSIITLHIRYDVPTNKTECFVGECVNYRSDLNQVLRAYREIKQILQ